MGSWHCAHGWVGYEESVSVCQASLSLILTLLLKERYILQGAEMYLEAFLRSHVPIHWYSRMEKGRGSDEVC